MKCKRFQNIQHLLLDHLGLQIQDVDVVLLAENLINLRSLVLVPSRKCDLLSDAAVVTLLFRCPNLKTLCLPQSINVTTRWISLLPDERHWAIQTLECGWGTTIDYLTIAKFCKHFSQLRNLKMSGLHDEELSMLITSLQHLEVLDASDSFLTVDSVQSALLIRGPRLQEIFVTSDHGLLYYCNIIDG